MLVTMMVVVAGMITVAMLETKLQVSEGLMIRDARSHRHVRGRDRGHARDYHANVRGRGPHESVHGHALRGSDRDDRLHENDRSADCRVSDHDQSESHDCHRSDAHRHENVRDDCLPNVDVKYSNM